MLILTLVTVSCLTPILFMSKYFEEPPHYQFLHCLRHRVTRGSSIFVDGLQAALTLSRAYPAHFAYPRHYMKEGSL